MLRIERDESDGCGTRLLLSGRVRSDDIECVRAAMSGGCARRILDLSEVTLVDIGVIRFLSHWEEEGVVLEGCPPYVREWILRERAAEEEDLEMAAEGIIRHGRQ